MPDRETYTRNTKLLLNKYGKCVSPHFLNMLERDIHNAEEEMAFTGLLAQLNKNSMCMDTKSLQIAKSLLDSNRIQKSDIENYNSIYRRSVNQNPGQ